MCTHEGVVGLVRGWVGLGEAITDATCARHEGTASGEVCPGVAEAQAEVMRTAQAAVFMGLTGALGLAGAHGIPWARLESLVEQVAQWDLRISLAYGEAPWEAADPQETRDLLRWAYQSGVDLVPTADRVDLHPTAAQAIEDLLASLGDVDPSSAN